MRWVAVCTKSHPDAPHGEVAELVECGGLENRCAAQRVPGVRIPPSPYSHINVSEDSWLASAPPFPDLGADAGNDIYPHDFVAAAFAAGIIKGDKGNFKPYDGIYRIGVILMVVRALESLAPGSLDAVPAGFSSTVGGLSGEHAEAMRRAEYNNLLVGLAGFGSSWNAWGTASRGEVAQIL